MKEIKDIKSIETKLADVSDESLEEIIAVRKKYAVKERELLIKCLFYISNIDNNYSDIEREVVESTACTLGYNKEKLDKLFKDNYNTVKAPRIPENIPNKLKNELFIEMVTLTYLKGYQTDAEDKILKKFAKKLGLSDKKAEEIQSNIYFASQGVKQTSFINSDTAKIVIGVGAVAVSASICALSAGAAAPIVGTFLGNSAGLFGAAATGHGLALLGGGAIAAGGGGVAAGTAVVVTAGGLIGGTVGSLGVSVVSNISNAYDKKQLKKYVENMLKKEKTKQKIVDNLIKSITLQRARIESLENEKASSRDIQHAKEVVENLENQKVKIEQLIENDK